MSAVHILPLAREGLRLFPVAAKSKIPMLVDWPNEASDRAERIEFWAKRWPECNWGLACGAGSGVFAVDFDGEQGRAVLSDWIKEHGPAWARTRGVKTRRGDHLWFQLPEGETRIRNSAGKIAPGVDVRGEGGYVIIPPSIHPEGPAYTWAAEPSIPIAQAPTWLVELIISAARPQPQTNGNGEGKIPEGQRNASLASLGGSMRRRGMDSDAIMAALLRHNAAHCEPPLRDAEVRQIAESLGRYRPAENGTPRLFTEDDLALTFSAAYAHDSRYVATWRQWLRFDNCFWRPDAILKVDDRVRGVCRDASAICGEKDSATVKRLQAAATVSAVERLARSDSRHAATAEQWDVDLWAFNTPAGTVDLKTGHVCEHRPEDYITKRGATGPGGECPLWREFLTRITGGDGELRGYLQRVAGYCMTGITREHVLFFLYGVGANGKTTFTNALLEIWGDYAQVAQMETFTENHCDRHPTDMAAMRGARLVVASETEVGKRWAESRIKSLTGGEPVRARFMRCDEFQYLPQFKLVIQGNHKPGLRSVNEAMRRRFHLVPFTVTIPEHERDQDLAAKLRAESPGIMRWAVEGGLEWQRTGLRPPQAVVDATRAYLENEDSIGRWLEERTIVSPQLGGTKSSILYADFKQWAEHVGEFVGSQKRFSQDLLDRGFVIRKAREANLVDGVRLSEETDGECG